MTGQVAAINTSGAFTALQSAPPPPGVRSGQHGYVPPSVHSSGQRAQVSGSHPRSHTPLGGIQRADAMNDIGSEMFLPPKRSKAWIFFGVILAAAIGGGLGMLAFRFQAGQNGTATVPTNSATPTAAAATTSTTPSAAPTPSAKPANDTRVAIVHVTSDPAGANVRDESGSELCASTPCDATFKGEAADASKTHRIVLSKNGFKNETRPVKPNEALVHVKLTKGAGGATFVKPPLTAPPPPTKPDPPTTPSGFKDIPY